jgi:hypothetical protein
MKKEQVFVVIFHHDNGLSFLRGVFSTWSHLEGYLNSNYGRVWVPTVIGRKLQEENYATIITNNGQYTITMTEPDNGINLNIN